MNGAIVLGESVKTGLSIKLSSQFPSVVSYREQLSNPTLIKFPHFFIEQVTQSITEERRGYFWLHYLMVVRYRMAAEISTVFNLQSQLDEISFEIMQIKNIPLSNRILSVKNKNTEKIDGVLHWFCNFDFEVQFEEIEKIKMWQLEQNNKLKLSLKLEV